MGFDYRISFLPPSQSPLCQKHFYHPLHFDNRLYLRKPYLKNVFSVVRFLHSSLFIIQNQSFIEPLLHQLQPDLMKLAPKVVHFGNELPCEPLYLYSRALLHHLVLDFPIPLYLFQGIQYLEFLYRF